MKENLRTLIARALSEAASLAEERAFALLEEPKRAGFGDLAFPCFVLAKQWKLPPAACAEKLREKLALPQGVKQAAAVGPFLNFFFDEDSVITSVVNATLEADGEAKAGAKRPAKILIEYSSPNIAKPFHVGHLRTTLIGNCLDRVYRRLGYDVESINHLGDWGTQFGFVWAGCRLWGTPEQATVYELVDLYKRATGLKERQESDSVKTDENSLPNVNELARSYFLDLEKGAAYAVDFWKWCLDISLSYLKATYKRLDIEFDHYIGESFYSDKLDAVREALERTGILRESQGALGVELGDEIGFARIFTPDGRSLYFTRDLAAVFYRAERFHFDKALYVVGAPQTLHFRQLSGVLKAMGHESHNKIEHVAFGHVQGMKTRGGGEVVELNDFLDEAYQRALEAYREQVTKRPEGLNEEEVARSVALAAIIFSNLSSNRLKDVVFSWDHALEFQGDSGPYLLYAYARINGIKERALLEGIKCPARLSPGTLPEESAYRLASALADFDQVLRKTAADNEPCHLANYALSVAKLLSKAYLELKVVGTPKQTAEARLSLFEATRRTIGSALMLLGIPPIERM